MNTSSPIRDSSWCADVIVVGGGLAGTMAAALVASRNHSVIVLEQSRHWGGRAGTQITDRGMHLNLGPHALYCWGHTFRMLSKLQIPFTGRFPNGGQSTLLKEEDEYAFPATLWSILTSRLLNYWEKWILTRFFRQLPQYDTAPLDGIGFQQWVEQLAGHGNLADYLRALVRLSTFAADLNRLSAGAAVDQLKTGLGNVWYLDGGWQTMIDGLKAKALDQGAEFRNGNSVKSVRSNADGVTLTLSNGEVLSSGSVILAVSPRTACALLDLQNTAPLKQWLATSQTIRVACLDVCLSQLSRTEHRFAIGLDRSIYFSVHSAAAKLAPDGIHVVHVMKYLQDDVPNSSAELESELEGLLDQMQPGWRQHTVERRFLPSMTVSYGLPAAEQGGLTGRPAVRVEGHPRVFLAGDWVGARGQLADAAAASAEEAVEYVLDRLQSKDSGMKRSLSHVGS